VHRFPGPAQLTSWARLTPRHHESDTTCTAGGLGAKLVRWAAIEAVQRVGGHTRIGAYRDRVAERRGRSQGKFTAAPRARRVRPLRAARPPHPAAGSMTAGAVRDNHRSAVERDTSQLGDRLLHHRVAAVVGLDLQQVTVAVGDHGVVSSPGTGPNPATRPGMAGNYGIAGVGPRGLGSGTDQ
jgi:hypothetical protein